MLNVIVFFLDSGYCLIDYAIGRACKCDVATGVKYLEMSYRVFAIEIVLIKELTVSSYWPTYLF